MARICELTGKGPRKGSRIWRSGKAKKAGGIGTHITAITKRKFMPNLQRVKVIDANGTVKSISGPAEFEQFIAAETGPGVFALELPAEPVAELESWQGAERQVSSLRGLEFGESPLQIKTTYTLQKILRRSASPEEVRADLKSRGFTHLLYDETYLLGEPSPLDPDEKQFFTLFRTSHLSPVIHHAPYRLDRLD